MKVITRRLQALVTPEQFEKLRVYSFYSGLTIGEIIRKMIDNLDTKDIKKGGVENG